MVELGEILLGHAAEASEEVGAFLFILWMLTRKRGDCFSLHKHGSAVRLFLGCFTVSFASLCAAVEVPALAGRVLETPSQEGVSRAVVVAEFTGATRARELWFHAATGLKSSRCFRQIALTNADGTFRFPARRIGAYFGSPEFYVTVYHPDYRGPVSRIKVATVADTLNLWREQDAASYSIWTGHRRASEARSNSSELSRHAFLDTWLSTTNLTEKCEFEADVRSLQIFLLERFEEWVNSEQSSAQTKRTPACDALSRFEFTLREDSLIERFRQVKVRASQFCAPDG